MPNCKKVQENFTIVLHRQKNTINMNELYVLKFAT